MSNQLYSTQVLQIMRQLPETSQFRLLKLAAEMLRVERERAKQAIALASASVESDG